MSRAYTFQQSPTTLPPSKFNIPTTKIPLHDLHPYFSFRHYHVDHKKYSAERFENKKDFVTFLERLQKISQFTWKEIFTSHRGVFHAHEVNWDKTAERKGFSHLQKELQDCPVYQFAIFKECRILGFFNHHNVFKIVWIDRFHEVYPHA